MLDKKKIGLMQGRLSPIYNNKIQAFPKHHWKKEFHYMNKLNIKILEWTIDYKKIFKNPLMNLNGRIRIKKLKKKFKIKIYSLTGDCFMQKPFWKEKKKNRNKLQDILIKIISNCKEINIKNIVIPLVDNGSINSLKEKKILVSFLKKITPILKKNKQNILFELDLNPNKALSFIKKFDPKFFGINYDIGNSASKGFDQALEIKLLGRYIKNVHIKDRLLNSATVRLGKGHANFDQVFKMLNKQGYSGFFTLQTARSKNGQHKKEILTNLKFLSKWFK